MSQASNVVSIHPYFKAKPGKLAEAKALLPKFIARAATEKLILYYDFTINGDEIHCREAYVGAEGLAAHLQNVEAVLAEFLQIVELVRLEVHGPAAELDKLRDKMDALQPSWFVYECGLKR
jgi:quinol monooxygenase YgiN